MLIKYSGHACFKVRDNETGYSIVFDPYEPGSVPGFRDIVDSASRVICSHDHFDHDSVGSIKIIPNEADPFDVQYIDTWHDPEKGALRGPNRIHIVTDRKTGEKLIHYGDIGEVLDDLLTEENLQLLGDADIALIPVGGKYTYDADEALELIRRTSPKIAVPMHFRSESAGCGLPDIGSVEDFLTGAQEQGFTIKLSNAWFYDSAEYDLGECILGIMPENMQ